MSRRLPTTNPAAEGYAFPYGGTTGPTPRSGRPPLPGSGPEPRPSPDPGRPNPEPMPPREPGRAGFDTYVQNQLFERRIVVAQGLLDRERATNVSAQLLTLEALENRPIQLRMASSGGDLDAVLGLVDTIGMLGVELRAAAVGEVSGVAVAAFAAAPVRQAYPHARFGLREPEAPPAEGTASRIGSLAQEYLSRHQAFIEILAQATGRQPESIEADMRHGRFLTADQALGYGLVTELARRS